MKTSFLTLLLLLSSFAAVAQQASNPDSTDNKFFVGVGLSNTSYPIMGELKHESFSAIKPFVIVNFGYRLNKRTAIQIGLGYGANEINGYTTAVSNGKYGNFHKYQRIRGVVTPLTLKWTPFNPYKRLQLYANASLAPVFGHMKTRATETYDEDITVLYDEKFYTFDLVATAGLTLNYRLNKRIDLYADGILFYKNFFFEPRSSSIYEGKSVGAGLNYNLNLRREK
ncbi:outer membrane beta-barrel protein [Pontibacter anaerobius]|uniref:Outer membrane beta-barrel protein n=1 Tax=Pontibacter anaerobius TaxID=2993940 RepID=A0ABT3RF54_9BACT|nr:outer membrane beta-barrel protein [Pontibacter anaerobius]MCX2740483.1 outer membrane beta-barrel protein [Pontibacter anaerobius]